MGDGSMLVLAVALVFVNGFFVAAEFAIVKLRRTQAEELARTGGIFARLLLNVRDHIDGYLSACQLGITLASIALGWIGEPAFAHLLGPPLLALGIASPELVDGIAFGVAFTLIAFLHIVLGELAPKSIAIRMPVAVSLWTATPLFLFYWLMFPFIWVLNGSANALLRLMGVGMTTDETAHSAAEIKSVLAASHRHGELGHEAEILSRALEFSELAVGDLMRPAREMVALDVEAPMVETLALIGQQRFSRYPVSQGGRDRLIGILHVKDLFAQMQRHPDLADIRDVMRELPTAGRGTSAMKMLRRFRRGYPHLAVITDDGGQVVGFLTLDHLLEALIGRIQDEFHRPHDHWRELPDGTFEGRGHFSIHMLERLLGRDVAAQDVDSVGGLVMTQLDRVAVVGDRALFEDFSVEVLSVSGPRIKRVRVRVKEKEAAG